jgi:hypothetical protein
MGFTDLFADVISSLGFAEVQAEAPPAEDNDSGNTDADQEDKPAEESSEDNEESSEDSEKQSEEGEAEEEEPEEEEEEEEAEDIKPKLEEGECYRPPLSSVSTGNAMLVCLSCNSQVQLVLFNSAHQCPNFLNRWTGNLTDD